MTCENTANALVSILSKRFYSIDFSSKSQNVPLLSGFSPQTREVCQALPGFTFPVSLKIESISALWHGSIKKLLGENFPKNRNPGPRSAVLLNCSIAAAGCRLWLSYQSDPYMPMPLADVSARGTQRKVRKKHVLAHTRLPNKAPAGPSLTRSFNINISYIIHVGLFTTKGLQQQPKKNYKLHKARKETAKLIAPNFRMSYG